MIREERFWAPVASRGDTPPVLEAPEHDLDAVAPFVEPFVVFDGLFAGLPAGEADL